MIRPNSTLADLLAWIVTLIVPIVLALGVVRLGAVFAPPFLQYEYNSPGFPADPYGFTTQDRLKWSMIDLNYLENDQGISFLGDLRFENGTPVYNERELSHMVDVKNTLHMVMNVWYGSLVLLFVLGIWAWFGGWMPAFRHGMSRGGWLTVFLILGILLFVLLSFGVFFVYFHEVFFAPGTWTFYFSDTLIRLFPERFWRDIFLVIGSLTLLSGLAVAFLFRYRST